MKRRKTEYRVVEDRNSWQLRLVGIGLDGHEDVWSEDLIFEADSSDPVKAVDEIKRQLRRALRDLERTTPLGLDQQRALLKRAFSRDGTTWLSQNI